MALATLAQYEAITGQPGDDRVSTLLDLASSTVLAGAHGQLIAAGETSGLEVEPYEGVAYLPQRPVIDVLAVHHGGVLTDPAEYKVEQGGHGRPASIRRRTGVWAGPVVVSYRHGYEDIPGQVVALVCAMAKATVDNDGGSQSTQESAGPFSESWSDPQQAGMALTKAAQASLDRLFRVRGHGSVPVRRDQP